MAFLREIKRYFKLDGIRNDAVRKDLQVFNMNDKLKNYKQRWREHLESMSDYILPKQVWKYKPIGRWCVGRPRKRPRL